MYTLTLCLTDGSIEEYRTRANNLSTAQSWAELLTANMPRIASITVEACSL